MGSLGKLLPALLSVPRSCEAQLWAQMLALPRLLCQTWDTCSEPILQLKPRSLDMLSLLGAVEGAWEDLLSSGGSLAG